MAYCVNGCWTVSGHVGAGTETPNLGFTAVGAAVGDAAIGLNNTSGGGKSWQIYSTGTSFSQGNCNLIFYRDGVDGPNATAGFTWDGNFGIGTYAATEKLHICGGGSGPEIRLQNSTSSHYIRAYDDNFNILTAGTLALSIKNNGNVGIGITTDNPIGNGGTFKNLLVGNGAGYGVFQGVSTATATNSTIVAFSGGTTGASANKNGGSINLELDGTSTTRAIGRWVFYTNSATAFEERMRITSGGNIGIGTCSPCAQLSLSGIVADSKFLLYDNGCSNDRYGFGIRNSQLMIYTGTAGVSCGGLTFGQYDGTTFTENVRFMNGGNVGIGVSCAVYKLDVQCSIGNYLVRLYNTKTGDSAGLYVKAGSNAGNEIIKGEDYSGNPRFLVGACGNVSINNASINTSYKLYVNGAFYAAGSSCEYKTQICQYNTDSCMFMKLTPVTYQYKDEYTHLGKELKSGTQIGLIAEDVAEVYPELAILKDEDNEKIVRNVDYEKLSIVLLSEVQKLRKELDELKTK